MSDEKYPKVITPEGRVSYPQVFEPKSYKGGKPKYQITLLFPKSTDLSALKKLASDTARAKWGDKIPKRFNSPFKDGDKKLGEDGTPSEGYVGMIYIRPWSYDEPGIVNQKRQPILNKKEFYAGCYARAQVTAFAYYDSVSGAGISFGLQHLQKTGDGEPFSGRKKAEDVFDDIDGGDNASDYGEDNGDGSSLF